MIIIRMQGEPGNRLFRSVHYEDFWKKGVGDRVNISADICCEGWIMMQTADT